MMLRDLPGARAVQSRPEPVRLYGSVACDDREVATRRMTWGITKVIENGATLVSMSPNVAEDLRIVDGLVDYPEVIRASGLPRHVVRVAMDDGLIPVTDVRRGTGRGRTMTLTVDDALYVLAVAALAIAAGIAFATMLRAMKSTGAELGPSGLTIPIPKT